MISELSNGQSGSSNTDHVAMCGGVNPTRMSLVQCGPAGELPDDAPGIGVEDGAQRVRTKDGAGGGPAEEQAWTRGRGTRLLKIGESRTRMRGRDDVFEWIR